MVLRQFVPNILQFIERATLITSTSHKYQPYISFKLKKRNAKLKIWLEGMISASGE